MPATWAISGVDMHVDVENSRVRASIERELREAVRGGRLPPGLRLPSSRQLAADLGLARNTVANAYGQLVAEGWLVARQGSGTRVAAAVADRDHRTRAARTPVTAAPGYDLRAGSPDVSAFPTARWVAALRRALATTPAQALGYGDPRGRVELRDALAGYLARARGVHADPERIVICSGFAQGFDLLCVVLRNRGATTLAVENHSWPAYRSALRTHRLRLATVPVDEDGAVVASLTDEDAILLTPAHQFPLGSSLGPVRRTAAVAWAADTGGLVIEDDYDGEFRYDRRPLGALQSLAPDSVAYVGTASKTLAPGLRLGWLVLPRSLLDPVLAAKTRGDYTGVLDQLTLAQFIAYGGYDRHIRARRLTYRRRRDNLLRTLARDAPGTQVTGIAAGLHALVTLPTGLTEDEAVTRAAQHGLAVGGLRPYHAGGQPHPPALVIGYATPPEHAFTGAVARLAAIFRTQ
jgi:GntR family transcriptional regulator/MocR family aminotransferase